MASLADYTPDERTARVMLSIIAEPADSRVGRLLGRVGAVETIRILDTSDGAMPGMRREDAEVLRHRARLASEGADFDRLLPRLLDARFTPLIPGDREWPAGLDDLGDRKPYLLWTDGAPSLLTSPVSDLVTLTGARASTPYGDAVAREIASGLAQEEKVIVAGGSYGIEAAAHRAALATGGSTVAVLAGGIDRNYPHGNTELLDTIRDVGAVVSEQPPGATPTRFRFLARARVLAAGGQSLLRHPRISSPAPACSPPCPQRRSWQRPGHARDRCAPPITPARSAAAWAPCPARSPPPPAPARTS